jgi:hypothetical protein
MGPSDDKALRVGIEKHIVQQITLAGVGAQPIKEQFGALTIPGTRRVVSQIFPRSWTMFGILAK